MLRISRVHIDYQKNPVGIAEMPQFGWEEWYLKNQHI